MTDLRMQNMQSTITAYLNKKMIENLTYILNKPANTPVELCAILQADIEQKERIKTLTA
jgi:hypothetical protein